MVSGGGRRAKVRAYVPMQEENVLSILSDGIESESVGVGVGSVSWIVAGERAWISIVLELVLGFGEWTLRGE